MFVTIGSFIFGLFGKQATDKTARAVGIGALIAFAAALIVLFFVIHDHRVIANHDARQDAEVSNAVVSADRYATDQKTARDQDYANSSSAVNAAVSNAVIAAPAETKKPVGKATQAYYDELRRQRKGK